MLFFLEKTELSTFQSVYRTHYSSPHSATRMPETLHGNPKKIPHKHFYRLLCVIAIRLMVALCSNLNLEMSTTVCHRYGSLLWHLKRFVPRWSKYLGVRRTVCTGLNTVMKLLPWELKDKSVVKQGTDLC